MSAIYTPTRGPAHWQWLLARPAQHWKHGYSATASADTWEREGTRPWPPTLLEALTTAGLTDVDLLLGIPEHQTSLPRRSTQEHRA